MTNKEMVVNVLNEYGCMNSFQMKGAIYRKYNTTITPQSIAGILRPLIAQGFAANSKDGSNKTIYWITNFGKEKLVK